MQGFADRLVIRFEVTDREKFERAAAEAWARNGGEAGDPDFATQSDAYKLYELIPDVEQFGVYIEPKYEGD